MINDDDNDDTPDQPLEIIIGPKLLDKMYWWVEIDDVKIPYVKRRFIKLCSVKIVQKTLFSRFICILSSNVFDIIKVECYFMNIDECKIFNIINQYRENNKYGEDEFNLDTLIPLRDVRKMFRFLLFCEKLLVHNVIEHGNDIGGYIERYNGRPEPYAVLENQKYIIKSTNKCIVCKEDCEQVEKIMSGWPLIYLKFLCYLAQSYFTEIPIQIFKVIPLDFALMHNPDRSYKELVPADLNKSKFLRA